LPRGDRGGLSSSPHQSSSHVPPPLTSPARAAGQSPRGAGGGGCSVRALMQASRGGLH
jgi:hypothetical protein